MWEKLQYTSRGELSYLAPLGSENISAPYFKQCFFQVGVLPPDWDKHHASQSQDRNNKYFILYIEFCINNFKNLKFFFNILPQQETKIKDYGNFTIKIPIYIYWISLCKWMKGGGSN